MSRAHALVVLALSLSIACAGSEPSSAREVTSVASGEDSGGAASGETGGAAAGDGTEGTSGDDASGASSGGEAPGSSDGSSSDGGLAACDEVCAIPPPQWSGPVLLARATNEPASCDDASYGLSQVTGYRDVHAGDATCGCECEVTSEVVCDDDVTLRIGAINCAPGQTQSVSLQPGCNDLNDINPNQHYAIDVGWSGGSCGPQQTQAVLPPSYGEQVALCSTTAVVEGRCEGDAACLPAPAEPAPLCWYTTGDVECPAGWDASREVIYTAPVEDTRDCTTCVCDAPAGSCDHPGVVLVGANDSCNLGQVSPAPAVVATGDCVTYPVQMQSVYLLAEATPQTSCGVATEPEAVGEVTPQGPVTVCCAQ